MAASCLVHLDRRVRPEISKHFRMGMARPPPLRIGTDHTEGWIELEREAIMPVGFGSMVIDLEDTQLAHANYSNAAVQRFKSRRCIEISVS